MALLVALSLLSSLTRTLAGPVAGQTYTISPAAYPNLCLAPSDPSQGDGTPLVVKDCDTSNDIVFTTDASGALINTATNLCVDIRDGGVWSGNAAQFWDCYNWNGNQQFVFSGNQIQWSTQTELCLDLTDGVGQEGTHVQIWQCYNGNSNQQWTIVEAEEVDDCDGTSSSSSAIAATTDSLSPTSVAGYAISSSSSTSLDSPTSPTPAPPATAGTASVTPSSSSSASVTDSASASTTDSASVIGGGLFAGSASSRHHHQSSSTDSDSASASASPTGSASASGDDSTWGSSSASWSASASASGSASLTSSASSAPSASSGCSADLSGYLTTKGWKVYTPSGSEVVLKGINVGGFLVSEDWENGIEDSWNPDRFAIKTLESRFGETKARTLLTAWYDNFFTSADWDNIKAMGYNHVRIPFAYYNLQNDDGSWRDDMFTKLDWVIAQAKQRDIYVILVFHIWDTQMQQYSMISEDTDDGQSSRDRAGEIWKKVAAHYLGEPIIAAFDAINEPTGSAGNKLQQDLYTAIRSVDAQRIVIMESISENPSDYSWTNVMYSMHEYLMMTDSYSGNLGAYYSGTFNSIQQWKSWGVPIYCGEFMAMSDTLPWLLNELNSQGIAWASWSYSTVDMGGWGIFNYPSSKRVNIDSTSYDDILNLWSNMGSPSRNDDIYSVYTNALGNSGNSRKRDDGENAVNPLVNSTTVIGIEQAGIAIKTARHLDAVSSKRSSPISDRTSRGHRRSRRHTARVVAAK